MKPIDKGSELFTRVTA